MLTVQELIQIAPAAAATKPAPHCSPLYRMLSTLEIVEALKTEGYVPVSARQGVTGTGDHDPAHSQHQVNFRLVEHSTIADRGELARLAVPEIIVLNSSDGRTRFETSLGLWRKICANGAVAQRSLDSFSTAHRNVTADSMIQIARGMSRLTKPLFDKIKRWSEVEMPQAMRLALAKEAAQIRWGAGADAFDLEALLKARRPEDEEPTIWNTFNTLQEVGMRGGVTGERIDANGKPRRVTARELTSIPASMDFNSELWVRASAMAERVIDEARATSVAVPA